MRSIELRDRSLGEAFDDRRRLVTSREALTPHDRGHHPRRGIECPQRGPSRIGQRGLDERRG